MKSRQHGYTLIELILVVGLMSAMAMVSFMDKSRDMEVAQARVIGGLLYEYNNAARSWLSNNIGSGYRVQKGSAWLKHTSCDGGLSAIGYLPCEFPKATVGSPIKFGNLALESAINTSGTGQNTVTAITTTTSPFTLTGDRLRSDLAGVATLVAAAGGLDSSTPTLMASDGRYGSDPATGVITMMASNNASNDAWLRTDGSNTMKANLRFEESNASERRELQNVSRIRNIANEILYLGNVGGATAPTQQWVLIDANEELKGRLVISNDANAQNGIEVGRGDVKLANGSLNASGSVTAGTNVYAEQTVTAGGNVVAQGGVIASGDVQAGKNITAQGNIVAEQGVIARGDVLAGGNVRGQAFFDEKNKNYFVDPSLGSQLNTLATSGTITSEGRIKTSEFLELGRVVTAGAGCERQGLVGVDSSGKLMSCQGGSWQGQGAIGTPVQVSGTNLGSWSICTLNYGSGNSKSLTYSGGNWYYSGSGTQIVYCYR